MNQQEGDRLRWMIAAYTLPAVLAAIMIAYIVMPFVLD
jgi:hypothetical protein